MEIRKNIAKIGENKNPEDMQELGSMLSEILYTIKDINPELYQRYKMKIYEMANGKVLTREMAEDWVKNMKPMAKWDFDTTTSVKTQLGINDIDDVSFYVVMNMLYSDMKNVLGDGEDEESLKKYVEATKDWLNDEDVGKNKLYNYWKYVTK